MNNCPECGSDRTQRLEMAYATLSTTLAGAIAAPPARRRSGGARAAVVSGILALALSLLVLMGGAEGGGIGLGIAGSLLFAGGAAGLSAADKYNSAELPPLLAEWKRKWVCLTCGTVFVPDTTLPENRPEAAAAHGRRAGGQEGAPGRATP